MAREGAAAARLGAEAVRTASRETSTTLVMRRCTEPDGTARRIAVFPRELRAAPPYLLKAAGRAAAGRVVLGDASGSLSQSDTPRDRAGAKLAPDLLL